MERQDYEKEIKDSTFLKISPARSEGDPHEYVTHPLSEKLIDSWALSPRAALLAVQVNGRVLGCVSPGVRRVSQSLCQNYLEWCRNSAGLP